MGPDREKPSLKELSQAYPELSVTRDKNGRIIVTNKSRYTRTTLFLRRGDLDQLVPDVGLTVKHAPRVRGHRVPKDKTFIVVRPQSPLDSIADVRKKEIDVDPEEVLADAKHGLEMFDAMIKTDHVTRGVMQSVASDHLQEKDYLMWAAGIQEDIEKPSAEVLRTLQVLGLTEGDINPSPIEMDGTMRKVLGRNMTFGIVEDTPSE